MDNKILELLNSIKNSIDSIQESQQKTNERLAKVEEGLQGTNERLTKLEEGQERIEKKIDITYDQVARTAEDITDIKNDINTVETITAKNWQDISKLKAIK